jgi:hypothetical protein
MTTSNGTQKIKQGENMDSDEMKLVSFIYWLCSSSSSWPPTVNGASERERKDARILIRMAKSVW